MKECSFSPQTRFKKKSHINKTDSEEFYKNKIMWKSSVDLKNRNLKLLNDRKEFEECSFRPRFSSKRTTYQTDTTTEDDLDSILIIFKFRN